MKGEHLCQLMRLSYPSKSHLYHFTKKIVRVPFSVSVKGHRCPFPDISEGVSISLLSNIRIRLKRWGCSVTSSGELLRRRFPRTTLDRLPTVQLSRTLNLSLLTRPPVSFKRSTAWDEKQSMEMISGEKAVRGSSPGHRRTLSSTLASVESLSMPPVCTLLLLSLRPS